MSGTRSHNFREGDRSEYFAQVLLSGLGLCTPIPRQEDIGFDFVCNLSDQESGILTFGHPYIVSVKSASSPEIELEPTDAGIKADSQRHIEWIFREELPAFLAVVDKDSFTMRFYSLIPIWFIYYEGGPKCGKLTLSPRLDATDLSDVGRPKDEGELPNWKGKHHFKVDLGHPVASIGLDSLKDPDSTRLVKKRLRRAVHYAQMNRVHEKLGVPYFYWFAKMAPDSSSLVPACYHLPAPSTPEGRVSVMKELAPSLISFALLYKQNGEVDRLNAVKSLLADVPPEFFTDVIRENLPEIFAP
jgi:hypothetical protein